MFAIRLSKALAVLAIALFATLVSFGNITDYNTNFQFVQHVFLMDSLFSNHIMYRSINTPILHHLGYIAIITLETATAILCWIGGIKLLRAIHAENKPFSESKKMAIIGLTLGFLTWQVSFMSIGGEWFGMWMSQHWNGVSSAYRFFTTILLVLIYVSLPNDQKN